MLWSTNDSSGATDSRRKRLRNWLGDRWRNSGDRLRAVSGKTWQRVGSGLIVLIALYYLLGMAIVHHVDDDTDFTPEVTALSRESRAVAMVTGLVRRELETGWVANDPFFYPSAALDNMPNFQMGLFQALSRFSFELRDQIGRNRGSSASDPDLEIAAGNLSKEGRTWIMDFPSPLPQTPSETYFRRATRSLDAYAQRLAEGNAIYERRSDNLLATLDRIALDLGASSAALENHIHTKSGGLWLDTKADDIFYTIKGQAYGYLMILKALRQDFEGVIQSRELGQIYDRLIGDLEDVVRVSPLVVTNGDPDGMLIPNHLAVQGFYLLRARTELREVTNILLK